MVAKLILISIFWIFIIDLSGIVNSIQHGLSKWVGKTLFIPRPWSCSLCLTFWTGLAYLIIYGYLNLLGLAALAMVSVMTPQVKDIIIMMKDIITSIITYIYKIFNI